MKIADIKNWFEIAIPEPTHVDACRQIGCAYEETGELALTLGDDKLSDIVDYVADRYKKCHVDECMNLSLLTERQKIDMLDDITDEIVTRIGIAHMMGFDIEGALREVNRSNHSKFEDGKAVFDDNGKIKKGKDYTAPQLKQFIGK